MTYHFKIVIEGKSEDKESVMQLYENLDSEIWHEECIIHKPEFIE
jgi:hypothetical protein